AGQRARQRCDQPKHDRRTWLDATLAGRQQHDTQVNDVAHDMEAETAPRDALTSDPSPHRSHSGSLPGTKAQAVLSRVAKCSGIGNACQSWSSPLDAALHRHSALGMRAPYLRRLLAVSGDDAHALIDFPRDALWSTGFQECQATGTARFEDPFPGF